MPRVGISFINRFLWLLARYGPTASKTFAYSIPSPFYSILIHSFVLFFFYSIFHIVF